MDLLKDITRELRGGGESARSDGQTPTASTQGADAAERDPASERATTDADSTDCDSTDGDESAASSRTDTHVCSFCETEFDADREVCPDCDAEIVFRGAR